MVAPYIFNRRPFGFVPSDLEQGSDLEHGDVWIVIRHRPRYLQHAVDRGKRAVFAGIGGQFVEDQRQADGELGRKKQRIAVQVEPDMAVRPEFGTQQVLDIAPAAIDARDQIIGRRQRADPVIDAAPDLRLIVQNLVQHGVNGRRLVFQPVLELIDDEFAVLLFLDQAFGDFALLRDDGPVVLDAPYRQAADRPENQQQGKAGGIGHRIAEIDRDAEGAARNRRRNPDPEAADSGG